MALHFNQFTPLLLLIFVVPLIALPYLKYARKNTRQRTFLVLRSLAALLLILSMCGVTLVKSAKDTATIFIADLSSSTLDGQKDMEAFIKEGLEHRGASDITGIISFGADSSTENEPSKNTIFNGFGTRVDPSFTNIQNALLHGSALFPNNAKKRIVLLSDGLENTGDVEKQLRAFKQSKITVDIYPLVKTDFEEVQLTKVLVPESAGKNQIIEIAANIQSNVKTKATILLYAGDQKKLEREVEIEAGNNQFIFTDTVSSGGILTYRVEILPEEDTYIENNALSSFVAVNDQPNILLVQEKDEQGKQLIEILKNDVHLDVKLPEEAPQTFESLIGYDGFILADVSIENLKEDFINNLEQVVKNQGKGLLVTGGDSSYGPGGYYQTKLEEILPVNVDVKPKEEKPNLGLMLIIDKSGSMTAGQYGVSKLQLAKEAALRSTEVLEAKDMLGVIAFDDSYKWVVETQLAEDKQALQDLIATIVPGGGTSIRPALEVGVDALIEADTKLKHIILLTDGQAETSGYESALLKIQENDITLSTVAVGMGADKLLLKTLADAGGGRYYLTDEFSDIPSIFTKEAFMAGKKYLNNITFSPTLVNWSQVMKGIEAVPSLDGYVATTIKDGARLLLAGPEEDPILATWQYGLGRTAAWASDANGLWTENWMKWEESPSFWSNLITWMVQQDIDKSYTTQTGFGGGKGVITVKSIGKEEEGGSQITGILVDPEGKEHEITLEATAPGTYTGSFDAKGQGVYMANLLLQKGGQTEKIVTGLNVGYSPEYDFYNASGIKPERLAEISGGRILQSPDEIFKGKVATVVGSNDLTNFLLTAALALFLLEILLRKTQLTLPAIKLSSLRSATNNARNTANTANTISTTSTTNTTSTISTTGTKGATSTANTSKAGKAPRQNKKEQNKNRNQVDNSHLDILLNQKRKRQK